MIYVIWHYKTGSRDNQCSARTGAHTHTHINRNTRAPGKELEVSPFIPSGFILCSFLITFSHKPWTGKNNNHSTPLSPQKTSLCTREPTLFMAFVCGSTGLCVFLQVGVIMRPLCLQCIYEPHVCRCPPTCVSRCACVSVRKWETVQCALAHMFL